MINLTPELQFLEKIPGVVPEHPYKYIREQNIMDSQKALMFSFGYGNLNQSLSSSIAFTRDKFLQIQLGQAQSSESFQEIIEEQKAAYLDRREANMRYALMVQESGKNRDQFRRELGDKIDNIVSDSFRTGKLNTEDARLLALYFSGGDTLRIEQVGEEYYKQRSFCQGKNLTRRFIQEWMSVAA